MPRGGRRIGAGRKPKTRLERVVSPGHHGRVLTHPAGAEVPAVAPVEEFDAPDDLTFGERAVWLELAPYAFAARTLNKATALSFRLLCRNVVLEQGLRAGAEPGGASHRGILQRLEAELAAFGLRPFGKAMYAEAAEPAAPANPLDRIINRKRG